MPSSARTKSKKKAQNGKKLQQTAIRIQVQDILIGDRIVTSWHEPKDDGQSDLSVDEVMNVGSNGHRVRYVNSSKEIKKVSECPGMWRTHIHINGSDCHDLRSYVWIVAESSNGSGS